MTPDKVKVLPKVKLDIRLADSVSTSSLFSGRLWTVEVLAHTSNVATFLFSFPDDVASDEFFNWLRHGEMWPLAKVLRLTLVRADLTELICDLRTVGSGRAKTLLMPQMEQGFAE